MNPYSYPGTGVFNRNDLIKIIEQETGITYQQAQRRSKDLPLVRFRILYWFFMSRLFKSSNTELAKEFNMHQSSVSLARKTCNNIYDKVLQRNIKSIEIYLTAWRP